MQWPTFWNCSLWSDSWFNMGDSILKVYSTKPILPDVSRVLACLYEKDVKFELIDMYQGHHIPHHLLTLQVHKIVHRISLIWTGLADSTSPILSNRYIMPNYVLGQASTRTPVTVWEDGNTLLFGNEELISFLIVPSKFSKLHFGLPRISKTISRV